MRKVGGSGGEVGVMNRESSQAGGEAVGCPWELESKIILKEIFGCLQLNSLLRPTDTPSENPSHQDEA